MLEQTFPDFRESKEQQIAKLLTEAVKLHATHEGDHAIWQALTNFGIHGQAERTQFFRILKPKIEQEKHRQKPATKKDIPFAKREDILADAYGHQLRQPRDTWDPTSEDESNF